MLENNIDILKKFLEKKYKGREIVYCGSGWSSIVFFVDEYVVRFPKQNIEDYKFESFICPIISKYTSVQVPSVSLVENEKYTYAIHKKICGYIRNDSMEMKQKEKYIKSVAQFLYEIHNVCDDVGIRNIPKDDNLLIGEVEKKLAVYYGNKQLYKICDKYCQAVNTVEKNRVFLHADFIKDNALLEMNGKLKGVYDWCNSGMGEREYEFVNILIDNEEQFFFDVVREYEHLSGIIVNRERVDELLLIKLVNKIYWSEQSRDKQQRMIHKLEKMVI